MKKLKHIFDNNKAWAERMTKEHPELFTEHAKNQKPGYLWIGCSDSRVVANDVLGLRPGDVFVHRNIANVVSYTDLNFLSVLQYAVEHLPLEHIIVCGHYGCGGVKAAMEGKEFGLLDTWLLNIKDVYHYNKESIESLETEEQKLDLLCELNVAEQVANVCHSTIVQRAWERGENLTVHGWIYDMETGLLKDLNLCVSGKDQLQDHYRLSK